MRQPQRAFDVDQGLRARRSAARVGVWGGGGAGDSAVQRELPQQLIDIDARANRIGVACSHGDGDVASKPHAIAHAIRVVGAIGVGVTH